MAAAAAAAVVGCSVVAVLLVGAPFATLCAVLVVAVVVVVVRLGAFSLALWAFGLHNALGWLLLAASNVPLFVVCGAVVVSFAWCCLCCWRFVHFGLTDVAAAHIAAIATVAEN